MRDIYREADIGRGRTRLPLGAQCRTWSQDPRIMIWAEGKHSITQPPRCLSWFHSFFKFLYYREQAEERKKRQKTTPRCIVGHSLNVFLGHLQFCHSLHFLFALSLERSLRRKLRVFSGLSWAFVLPWACTLLSKFPSIYWHFWIPLIRDAWVAQRLSICLWLRAWSWGPGIESWIRFPVGACSSLCLCLCLSLCVFHE